MTEVEMHIHRKTVRAIFASNTGEVKDAVWLPLSLIKLEPVVDDEIALVCMPEWLADRQGLI